MFVKTGVLMKKIIHFTLMASSLVSLNIYSSGKITPPPTSGNTLELIRPLLPTQEIEVVEIVEESPKPQLPSQQVSNIQAEIVKNQAEINRIQPQIDLLRTQRKKVTKGSIDDKKTLKELKQLLSKKTAVAKKIRELEKRLENPTAYLAKVAQRASYRAQPEVKERRSEVQQEYRARKRQKN